MKPFNLIQIISVLALVTLCKCAVAQTQSDAGAWFTFNVDCKLNNSFKAILTQEFRLRENFTQPNLTYTDLGIEYGFNKNVKTSVVYRGIQKYFYDTPVSFRNRIMWDVVLKHKFNNTTLQYRSRLQAEVKNYYTSYGGKNPEWFWRNKFTAKQDLTKKIDVYLALETRTQITDSRNIEYDGETHRLRYQGGIDVKLSRKNTLGMYYLIQQEFKLPIIQNQYIIGVEYTTSF